MKEKTYLCIDLKSFYASVECIERGLDPMTTNLIVADSSRTEKTICLAVSPSLKSFGVPGRPRLFEVVSIVNAVNKMRKNQAPGKELTGSSEDFIKLSQNCALAVNYIIAPPRMAHYMEYSTKIYEIYLKYIAPEDIHVYSIDEVFMDITDYLDLYGVGAHELAMRIIHDVLNTTGITATAGIGTNMYLAKIAMDIMAKKMKAGKDGVRIASLNEYTYRKELWSHKPLADFWRIGRGIASKLESNGIYTMGDIAQMSLTQAGEDKLYKMFGVNTELLIDHAWGWEPCTIEDIRRYKPENKSVGSGQVLQCPYDYEGTKLIVKEMVELLVLDLVEKRLVTNQIVLTIGYDVDNLKGSSYTGEITLDRYGRKIPKHAHGTINLNEYTSSTAEIMDKTMELFERIVNPRLLVRRVNVTTNHVITEKNASEIKSYTQLDLFADYEDEALKEKVRKEEREKERAIQEATIALRNKFGKNAVLKGMNLKEKGTTKERNAQIGGHKA